MKRYVICLLCVLAVGVGPALAQPGRSLQRETSASIDLQARRGGSTPSETLAILPLAGVIGLLALGGAFGLRAARRRI
jgi:hypothetical protein